MLAALLQASAATQLMSMLGAFHRQPTGSYRGPTPAKRRGKRGTYGADLMTMFARQAVTRTHRWSAKSKENR